MDWLKLMQRVNDKDLDITKIQKMRDVLQSDPTQAMKLAEELNIDRNLIIDVVKSMQQHPVIFSAMAKSMGIDAEQMQKIMGMAAQFEEQNNAQGRS